MFLVRFKSSSLKKKGKSRGIQSASEEKPVQYGSKRETRSPREERVIGRTSQESKNYRDLATQRRTSPSTQKCGYDNP